MKAPVELPEVAGRLKQRVAAVLTSRTTRILGTILGLGVFAVLVVRFVAVVREGGSAGPVLGVRSVTFGLLGFGLFHLGAIGSLHAVGGTPAGRIWASSQLAKYFPAPGAAPLAMIRSSMRRGHTGRGAIVLTARHASLLLAAALPVGSLAGRYLTGSQAAISASLLSLLLCAAGVATWWISTRGLDVNDRVVAGMLALGAWACLGGLLVVGLHNGGPADLALIGAFPIAWAVGYLALPIPAGLGIREAALAVFLGPVLGEAGALSFALTTRALHIASDGLVVLLFFGLHPLRRLGMREGHIGDEWLSIPDDAGYAEPPSKGGA